MAHERQHPINLVTWVLTLSVAASREKHTLKDLWPRWMPPRPTLDDAEVFALCPFPEACILVSAQCFWVRDNLFVKESCNAIVAGGAGLTAAGWNISICREIMIPGIGQLVDALDVLKSHPSQRGAHR